MTSKVYGYYKNSANKVYKDIFGSYPHFGLFPIYADIEKANLTVAQEDYSKELVRFILSNVYEHQKKQPLRILELCCGSGYLWELLNGQVVGEYLGIDFFEGYIDEFNERVKCFENINLTPTVIKCDVETYLAENHINGYLWDIIIVQDSFYHFLDKEKIVAKIVESLNEGGLFVLSDFCVDQYVLESDDFKKYFIARQGGSRPTTFFERKKNRFFKNKEAEYSIDLLAKKSGLEVLQSVDQSKSMFLTYQKSVSDMSCDHSYKAAFEYMMNKSRDGGVRLIWRCYRNESNELCLNKSSSLRSLSKIEVDRKGYSYDGKNIVLRGGSINVLENDYVVLCGRTGSGKTTLIKLLLGLLKSPSVSISEENFIRKGYVEQTPVLFDHMTVEAAVSWILGQVGGEADKHKILSSLDLLEFGSEKMKDLSGGQRQRAAIALAISSDPHILILDEPLSAQDAFSRENVASYLNSFAEKEKRAVIHITHRLDEVEGKNQKKFFEICQGRIKQFDPG